jgi:release factor glutamine methyltransferase
MEQSGKTIGDVLSLGATYLEKQDVAEARRKCEMLLSRLLSIPRLALHMHATRALSEAQLAAMRRGMKRLVTGEPIQYVIGETGFMEHVFACDPRALIPRPETEVLVRCVLEDQSLWAKEHPAVADVGTGSGCIVLSLAAARPQGKYLAVDISADAIALALENAASLQLEKQVHFFNGSLGDVAEPEMLDAIVANLPYIREDEMNGLAVCVREHEPHLALCGGASGLAVIEDLVADSVIVLKNEGRIYLEIGAEQGNAVKTLLEQSGFGNVSVLQDLNQRDRVVTGTLQM